MTLSLPELVIIATIMSGVALLVIGVLIGILVAVYMPGKVPQAARDRQPTNRK